MFTAQQGNGKGEVGILKLVIVITLGLDTMLCGGREKGTQLVLKMNMISLEIILQHIILKS